MIHTCSDLHSFQSFADWTQWVWGRILSGACGRCSEWCLCPLVPCNPQWYHQTGIDAWWSPPQDGTSSIHWWSSPARAASEGPPSAAACHLQPIWDVQVPLSNFYLFIYLFKLLYSAVFQCIKVFWCNTCPQQCLSPAEAAAPHQSSVWVAPAWRRGWLRVYPAPRSPSPTRTASHSQQRVPHGSERTHTHKSE